MMVTNLVGRRCWKRRGNNSREYLICAVYLTTPYYYVAILLEDAQTGELQSVDLDMIRVEPFLPPKPSPSPARQEIISLTPGKEEMIVKAQALANLSNTAHGVWEHVGLYGRPQGDIPARHTFMVQSFNKPDPPVGDWALVACVDPQQEEKDV